MTREQRRELQHQANAGWWCSAILVSVSAVSMGLFLAYYAGHALGLI